ncbi:hypothetical protein BLNAU_13947 [Blattamonas nauphoetae]|uniref:Uncharacterized protein n=1 Tax=Blattamonas nauphoetae TaxID=2049346 RepID=A0ABQ9XI33_9EUKA|nr:hypothetical protein BLNAU_13947 [Blattamonas nauphoetae]
MDDSEPPDPSTQRLPLYPRPESKQDTFPTSTTPLLEPDATGRNNVAEEEREEQLKRRAERKKESEIGYGTTKRRLNTIPPKAKSLPVSQFRVIIHRSDLPLSSEPSRRDCALFRHTQLNCAQQWIIKQLTRSINPYRHRTTTREPLSSPNPSIRTPSPAPTKTSIFSRNRTQKTQNQYSLSPSSTVQAAPIQPPFQSPFPFIAEPAEDHFKSERTLAQLESFFGARIDRKEEERKNEILKKEVMGEQELAKDETTESNTSSSSPISIWLTHLLPTKDENSPQFEEQLQTLSLHCLALVHSADDESMVERAITTITFKLAKQLKN